MGQMIVSLEQEARQGVFLLLTCSDLRLHGPQDLDSRLPRLVGRDPHEPLRRDVIAVPGANFGLSRGDAAEKRLLMAYISLLVDRHQPETIIIVPHLGCARYAQALGFPTAEEESSAIADDLRKAAALLRDLFRELTVATAIARVSQDRMTHLDRVTDEELVRLSVPPSGPPLRQQT